MYTPEQYGMSAHSNLHWTTGIIFVYYFFLGCFGGEAFYLNKLIFFPHWTTGIIFVYYFGGGGALVGKHFYESFGQILISALK